MNRSVIALSLSLVVTLLIGAAPGANKGGSLKVVYPGKVVDCQGVASLRPTNHERWTPIETGILLSKGDWIRTEARGANAVQIRLANQDRITLGPGGLIELVDENTLSLIRGEAEVTPVKDSKLTVRLPGDVTKSFQSPTILRATDKAYSVLENEPNWLKYLKGTVTHESMGALVAKVEGRDLPLTLGYHKVTVDIRDQIARTVIEESFVNHTDSRLEGVFFFPLPQDASISGFAMWIGDELVEADVVEKQRAREIYETILREKRDPGLLEWSGGNIFKARVFPIFAHSEKRIKITYTQVLPRNGNQYRYSYALQSEMLKQTPLRELALKVNIFSEVPIEKVTCPSHNVRLSATKNAASVEFAAQEYTPPQDFEVEITVKQGNEQFVMIPHRRGDDGYFLLMVNPPDKQREVRPILGDGPPLDLIVVADTSASMDRQQRQLQDQFIGFLLGSLGNKDRFRVVAADVGTAWFNPTTNTPPESGCLPSEENIGKARAFLAGRVSLGWTDLGRTLEDVLKFAGKDTHVIYVGDGIDTSKDCDPGSISKNLKRIYLAGGSAAAVHAVAVSSSYEPMVMKAMAGLGGGSFRRLDGSTPARTGAVGLLEELTSPGIRDMKVEFKGLRAARVYPEELSNLPAGRQQIILGRYLPEGRDQKGTVVVSGVYKGKTVRYEDSVALKDAESGNAFIPRLWARMHLESLLEQGQTPEVKNDIIALSEEYAIMTPYTSFLVLESDADRERFAVKRRFKMRDGEKFFANGRDAGAFQLKQKQMQLAGAWRQDLRRQVLRDLMVMGRVFPTPQYSAGDYARCMEMSACGSSSPIYARAEAPASYYGHFLSPVTLQSSPMSSVSDIDYSVSGGVSWRGDSNGRMLDKGEVLGFDGRGVTDYFDSPQVAESGAKSLAEPMSMDAEVDLDRDDVFVAKDELVSFDRKSVRHARNRSDMLKVSEILSGERQGGYRAIKAKRYRDGYGDPYGGYGYYWFNTIFPQLPPAQPPASAPANTNWSDAARALSQSLLRQDKLNAMSGGIEIVTTTRTYDVNRQRMSSQSATETFYSPKSWVRTARTDGGQTIVEWCDGKERGILVACYQLGRSRTAVKEDARLVQASYNDFSCSSIEDSYRGCTTELKDQGDGTVLLVLRYPDNPAYEVRCTIDTARKVLLAFETWNKEKRLNRTAYTDFVQVAGAWWATKITTEYGEKNQTANTITLTIREVGDRAFEKELVRRLDDARKNAIVIAEPLPTLSAARQAERDRKVSFDQFITLISEHIQLQEHDKALADWTAARALVKAMPGAEWIETEILLQARRNDEARLKIRGAATRLVAAPVTDDLFIANARYNQMCRIGQYNEVLTLLDDLKPVYMRQAEHLNAARTFTVNYAEVLRNAGRPEEALIVWAKLAQELPTDTGIQTRYIQVLTEQGDPEMAVAHLTELLAKPDRWTPEERESIRSSVAYTLVNSTQSDKWLAFLEAWMAEGTANSSAYQFYLSALFSTDRVADMRRTMTSWIEEGIAAATTPAPAAADNNRRQMVMARMNAAIQMALGQGYNLYTDFVDPYWYPLLSKTVRELFATDNSHLAVQIMQHYRFTQTDEARKLRQHFVTVLAKEALTLKPQVVNQLITWIYQDDPKVDMEVWKDLAVRLEERWAKEKDINARNQLASAVTSALHKSDPGAGLTNFMRRQFRESIPEQAHGHARNLLNHLLNANWAEAVESEVFALLPRTSAATNDEPRAVELVRSLYDMTDRLIQARVKAGSSSSEAKGKMTRQELATEQEKLRAAAKEGLIERFKKESPNQEELLRPWFTIERLTLEVQLKKDAKSIAGECWELLPQKPWGNETNATMRLHLYDRAMTALACLAARKTADAQLVQRVHAYIDAGIKAAEVAGKQARSAEEGDDDGGETYWRWQKYRMLAACDEPQILEVNLAKWIRPDKADPTWRYAMGYLLAEQGRVAEAIAQFEALEETDMLDQSGFRALAGWYQAAGQRDKYEAALIKALTKVDEYRLSNALYRHLNAWQQEQDKVPKELDPEVPRLLVAIFDKAHRPANYVDMLREFYQRSREPRLLQCMAECVLGHTAEQAYPVVVALSQALNEIRDEAAADELVRRIGEVRSRAKTNVDRRALDFLEMQVCRRASEVRNQPGPHIRKAMAAMQRTFADDWAPGERRLMSDLLAGLGKITSDELAREQLRQLGELHLCRTEPAEDRLAISMQLARALWYYEKHDEAIGILDADLTEYRQTMGGALPATANSAIEAYIGYLEARQRFTRGESWLQAELKRPANKQQQYWLVRRLIALYANTVRSRGEVSLGRGADLYRAAYAMIPPELGQPDRNHRRGVASLACNLFMAAKQTGIDPREARDFALTILPPVLAKETDAYACQNLIAEVGRTLREVLGPATALEFYIERLEQESQWLRLNRNYTGWQAYGYEVGRCLQEAKPSGAIESRLVKVVTSELRRDLSERRQLNRCVYAIHNSYFWPEKAPEFRAVAEEVWRANKESGVAVVYVADYLWSGLEDYDRAIQMLAEAHANQLLDEPGQASLVSHLHSRNRFAESIPILVGLIAQRPDAMNYRTQLMTAYFKVQDGDNLRKTLSETDKHFHTGSLWNEGNIAGLAQVCVTTALAEDAVKYYGELIPLHKRNNGGRVAGDGVLSEYYRQLANAHIGLGRTVEAVDAASGAIVVWGQDQRNRNNAMDVLQEALRKSPDLPGYVAFLEKQVAENNLENPIVRKALGRVFLEKNDLKEAIRNLVLAMEVQPNDRETCDSLIAAYDRMNDKPGAIRQILATADLSRRDIKLYAELGKRYLTEGDKEQSERAYLSIAEMLPNESESHTMLAEIRQQQNRWDEAIHHWRQVVRIRTLEPTGFQKLAEALIHQKQWKDALENIDILSKRDWPGRFGDVHATAEHLRRQVQEK